MVFGFDILQDVLKRSSGVHMRASEIARDAQAGSRA